jgi:tmRNA-binding protein
MRFIFLYLDPGSGSYLIQVIIAAVLGATLYFKNSWIKIKSFFTKRKRQDDEEEKV